MRAAAHPEAVVWFAQEQGCAQIEFGINEPLLSWEFTFDIARQAKAAGLDVVVETNGFSTPAVIEHLAPFVDAVDVGVKGHLDPTFYDKRMRSGEAPAAVKASIKAWQAAGVHLIVGDLVPPPHWMTDDEAEEAAEQFYSWLADEVDPHTPVLITQINEPGPQQPGKRKALNGLLLGKGATEDDRLHYNLRLHRTLAIARYCGLAYAHPKSDAPINCHACGGVLLQFPDPCLACNPCTMPTNFCHIWTHEQHVTNGHCDHCGAAVPIKTLSLDELQQTRRQVAPISRAAESTRHIVLRTRTGEEWQPWREQVTAD